jgi:hypothetical protein
METIIETQGLLEHVYKWLNPEDKKALSVTCKAARSSYISTYFPYNLQPAKLTFITTIKPGSFLYRCSSCNRIIKPPTHGTLGMVDYNTIKTLCYCSRCKEAVIYSSFTYAVHALLLDGGEGIHITKQNYYNLFERCLNLSSSAKYHDVLVLHNSIINTFLKQMISGVISDSNFFSPKYDIIAQFYRENPSSLLIQNLNIVFVDMSGQVGWWDTRDPNAKRKFSGPQHSAFGGLQQEEEELPAPMDIVPPNETPQARYDQSYVFQNGCQWWNAPGTVTAPSKQQPAAPAPLFLPIVAILPLST